MPEMFDDRNYWGKFPLIGTFGTCFFSKMEDEAVTVTMMTEKTLDDAKIHSGIPPNFDKKVVSDVELVEFATEVPNVKKWYMSPEQWRQWPPGCDTKIDKNAFCKRDLTYQYQEKKQTLYRIIKKKY